MKRSRFAAAAAAFAGGAAWGAVPAGAAQFQWKYGSEHSPDHPIAVRSTEAFERIRRETGGQLDIRSFPNNALGSDASMLAQLRAGALEMVNFAGGLLDTLVPVTSIENVAFAFPTVTVALAAMDGELGALIRTQIIQNGIMALERVWDNGWRNFTSSIKPIRSVDDLRGLNVRVSPGKLRVDTIRSMGAAAIPINSNEMYTAMQTHIVDAQEAPLIAVESSRFYEVQKYCSLTRHQWGGFWTLINIDKWNALPPAFQRILSTNMDAATKLQRRDLALLDASLVDKLQRQGLAFNEPSQATFKAKLVESGYYARWHNEFGDKAWTTLERYAGKLG